MDRRTLIQASLAASVLPGEAFAQTNANAPTPETRQASETLEAGMVSLETSRAALSKSADAALSALPNSRLPSRRTSARW
jgi:hypothetical protein